MRQDRERTWAKMQVQLKSSLILIPWTVLEHELYHSVPSFGGLYQPVIGCKPLMGRA